MKRKYSPAEADSAQSDKKKNKRKNNNNKTYINLKPENGNFISIYNVTLIPSTKV